MNRSLDEDIRAVVDAAIGSGELLQVSDASRRLAAAHPDAGLEAEQIAELVLRAGISARVPLEWGETPTLGPRPA